MKQEAILFSKDNIDTVVDGLAEYKVEYLLEDYSEMLNTHGTVVLCKDVLDSGSACLSYVVTVEMFERNNPGITLNDKSYTFVRTV